MRTGAGLHGDDGGFESGQIGQQPGTSDLDVGLHFTGTVERTDLKHIFCQIDAN